MFDLPSDRRGCPACGHGETEIRRVAAERTRLAELFDVAAHRFDLIACTNCGYSELYRDRDDRELAALFLGGNGGVRLRLLRN